MDYDPRDGERYRRRLKKQRGYQAAHRIKLESKGIPDRDKVAAATLRMMLGSAAANPERANQWIPRVVEYLSEKFDPKASEETIRAMVERHAEAQRKKQRRKR